MEIFGRYQLLERIAVGGMAEIFLARSASLDGFEKDLVIKRIRSEFGKDERFSSMFIDEARITMSLSHPNIVQVFDFGHADDAYYLAMEHVDGCDLDTLMDLDAVQGKGIDPPLALLIMRDVCRGLDYAHNKKGRSGEELNVIHRDVSPQNVMVTFEGGVKITDFGIAKARGKVSVTEPGMVVGKLAYMSPEHATGSLIDRRADVFACGVVLWEMLVGSRVYAGKVGTELFDRIRSADIDAPSTCNKRVPKRIDKLVMRAVAPQPDDRYATARDFGHALHTFLAKRYPEASNYSLQEFLHGQRGELDVVGFEDIEETAQPRVAVGPSGPMPVRPAVPPVATDKPSEAATRLLPERPGTNFDWTPELIQIVERFRRQPSLWHMVQMGDVCAGMQQPEAALVAYRVGAVKFAQRGLFAQSLLCCERMVRVRPFETVRAQIAELPAIAGRSNAEIADRLFLGRGQFQNLLAELLSDTSPSHGMVGQGTPLLRSLRGETFAELAASAPLCTFAPDAVLLEQGDAGRNMFLIAKGRVLVYATNTRGDRVYLSSLTAGDFFGENGFFTGAPRSATVEALYPVEAFEIDEALWCRLSQDVPEANDILLRFYKERIVDAVLAKSLIFGLLPNDARRAVLDKFDLQAFVAGSTIIKEGETSDQIYIIKNGEAEVFTLKEGAREMLSVLGPGRLFGEVAALRGIPRTASVTAKSDLETLRLSAADFSALIASKPQVRQRVHDEIAKRVRENIDRLVSFRPPT